MVSRGNALFIVNDELNCNVSCLMFISLPKKVPFGDSELVLLTSNFFKNRPIFLNKWLEMLMSVNNNNSTVKLLI